MDHNFYTWPWNDTILKSSYTQENYVSGHWSVVAVLCLLFPQLKIENCIFFPDTTCTSVLF